MVPEDKSKCSDTIWMLDLYQKKKMDVGQCILTSKRIYPQFAIIDFLSDLIDDSVNHALILNYILIST